jgi:hypothetical protein
MLLGWIDQIGSGISGWCVDTDNPTEPAEVQIFADGQFHGTALANEPRPDLQGMGLGHDRIGFSIPAPPAKDYRCPNVYGKVSNEIIIPTPSARSYGFPVFLAHPFLPDALTSRLRLEHKPSVDVLSDGFTDRLIEAFPGRGERDQGFGPLWGVISSERHNDVAMMIAERKSRELGEYLARLGETNLAWGFFGGPDSHRLHKDNDEFNSVEALYIFDRLISLSEYLGVIVVENPEQGPWNQIADLSIEELLSRISSKLEIDLSPPDIGGYWGFPTRHGHINARIVDAVYAAVRIARTLRQRGGSSVIEIGGGAGLVAHYALKLGIKRYKIVDLPLVGLAQAFVLRNEPGLVLHGETADGNLKIVSPESYVEETSEKYDLLFNMDSLPEIESSAAFDYLKYARTHGLRSFLSINQESRAEAGGWKQNIVFEMAQRAKFEQLYRNRSWMRVGYVEEFYELT